MALDLVRERLFHGRGNQDRSEAAVTRGTTETHRIYGEVCDLWAAVSTETHRIYGGEW
jgi:hypothetical protein